MDGVAQMAHNQGRRHTFLAWGEGRISAVSSFGSDQCKGMCFYGTDKYLHDLALFDLIPPRQSKDCDET